jgi:hypothetical protein
MTMDESPTADIGTKPSSSARLDDWGCRAAAVFGKRRKKKRRKGDRCEETCAASFRTDFQFQDFHQGHFSIEIDP